MSGRISWNTRKVRIGAGLGSTIELTFLSHALVRLGGASYSILKLILKMASALTVPINLGV
jgi:hypothetical protein